MGDSSQQVVKPPFATMLEQFGFPPAAVDSALKEYGIFVALAESDMDVATKLYFMNNAIDNWLSQLDSGSADAIKQTGKNTNFAQEIMQLILGEQKKKSEDESPAVTEESQEKAFSCEYVPHGGKDLFLKHLNEQFTEYSKETGKRYFPFFSIIQSSGYGKSRMLKELQRESMESGNKPLIVVYISFAHKQAFPGANVTIQYTGPKQPREKIANGFTHLFSDALLAQTTTGHQSKDLLLKPEEDAWAPDHTETSSVRKEMVLFVVDEVYQLFEHEAAGGVDFFRCLRRATIDYLSATSNCFFVFLSTFSSVSQINPSPRLDYSCKMIDISRGEYRRPMKPFVLLHSLGVQDSRGEFLSKTVEECHAPKVLMSMGRPMWHAFLSAGKVSISELLDFAGEKLLAAVNVENKDLKPEQLLAILSSRVCLSISPVSRFGPSLIAGYMATALTVSPERDEVTISYPSEPILALAARARMSRDNLAPLVSCLKEHLTTGAVPKGHRGEVIVRLLNLLAVDRCMRRNESISKHHTGEVKLRDFLSKFNRKNATMDDCLNGKITLDDIQKKAVQRALKKLSNSDIELEPDLNADVKLYPDKLLDHGYVCFTHYVYLAKKDGEPVITPDLLRMAYRRQAAIAADEGRRGIDSIIPVRIKNDNDPNAEEKFLGFVTQDKNRVGDKLSTLQSFSNNTTHKKVSTDYFLSTEEKKLFEDEGWSLDWPAVVFAVGSYYDEAGLALRVEPKILRSGKQPATTFSDYPCIILTGLGYTELMDTVTDKNLRDFRDHVIEDPEEYRENVPLTYGVSRSTEIPRSVEMQSPSADGGDEKKNVSWAEVVAKRVGPDNRQTVDLKTRGVQPFG